MRITLLAIALLVLCSARFKTSGRSAKQEMHEIRPVKVIQKEDVDMDESWPFTETLRKTDPSLVELTRQVKNKNKKEVEIDTRSFASVLLAKQPSLSLRSLRWQ